MEQKPARSFPGYQVAVVHKRIDVPNVGEPYFQRFPSFIFSFSDMKTPLRLFTHNKKTPLFIPLALLCLAPLYACQSVSKKDMAIMQGQLTRIDDRVDFVYRSMKLQADVAANLDELNNSITTLAGQVAEINARAQMLSDKMNKIEHGDSGKRALDNVRAVNIRLENPSATLYSQQKNAFIYPSCPALPGAAIRLPERQQERYGHHARPVDPDRRPGGLRIP